MSAGDDDPSEPVEPRSRRLEIAVFTSHWPAMVGLALVLGAVTAPIGLCLGRRRLRARLLVIDGKATWARLIAFLLVTALFNLVSVSICRICAARVGRLVMPVTHSEPPFTTWS